MQILSQFLRPVLREHLVQVIFLQPAFVPGAEQRIEPPAGEATLVIQVTIISPWAPRSALEGTAHGRFEALEIQKCEKCGQPHGRRPLSGDQCA